MTFREKQDDGTCNEDNDIDLCPQYGQRLSEILVNVNARRPVGKKIVELYNEFGQLIPLTHKVKGNNTFYYKAPKEIILTI